MERQENAQADRKILRLKTALSATEHKLKTHPHLQGEFLILQTLLHTLQLQTEWHSIGKLARLLIGFRIALYGQEKTVSQTGFIGPQLAGLQKALHTLLNQVLKPSEKDKLPLLTAFFEILSMGVIYLSTQTLGNWKNLFSEEDTVTRKKAGFLLRELGMTFLLGSHFFESLIKNVVKGIGLEEKSQQNVVNCGMSMILFILTIVDDQENLEQHEINDTLFPLFQPYLSSFADLLAEMDETSHTEEPFFILKQQTELLLSALEKGDFTLFQEITRKSFYLFQSSYSEIRSELKDFINICSQLNNSFKNIFYNREMGNTTLTQVA